MRKNLLLVLALIALTGMLFASGSAESDTVKVAVAAPLTGDYAEYGVGFRNAVELHAKQINEEEGGVLGKQIQIVSFDDKNSAEEAASIAEKIVDDKAIVAVIGHFASGVSMTASPTYQEEGIVEIAPSASHPDYSSRGDYIFRNNTLVDMEANATLDIADNVFKSKRVAVLAVKTDWGLSTADILINDLAPNHTGLEIVGYEEIIDGLTDFSSTITKLRSYNPDTIIVAAMYNVLGPFTNQLRDVAPEINIIGFSNAYSEELVKLTKEKGNGIALPAVFFHESEDAKVRKFVDEYQAAYNGAIPSALTAQAYDSLGMIVEAIKLGNSTDRASIKDKLYELDYKGVAGDTHFDAQGDSNKTFTWLRIEDGKFKEIDKSAL